MAIATVRPFGLYSVSADVAMGANLTTDASGESASVIGTVMLSTGPGTSKVLSAAGGGGFWFLTGGVTLNNGGSTFNLGVQDVSATTGLEDGTFDVTAAITSVAAPTANVWNKVAATTGTKTIAHGDTIAIVGEFTTRAGADAIVLRRFNPSISALGVAISAEYPYGTSDNGTLAKASLGIMAALAFDDGTVGWIQGFSVPGNTASSFAFNSGSTPDEYVAAFQPQVPMQISAIACSVFLVAAADTYEMILYSDPFGTPAVIETVTPDTDVQATAGAVALSWRSITPVTLSASTVYGIAIRPTSVNNISFSYFDLGSGNEGLKAINMFGSTAKVGSRSDQTGAFSETDSDHLPLFGILVTGLDNGAGGGSPGGAHILGGTIVR